MWFDVTHLFNRFINLLLQLREVEHLLLALLLFVDCFEIVDLAIKFIILWLGADSLPLLHPCFPKESFVSLVSVQGCEDSTGCRCLFRRHNVAWCGREITGGGHQHWLLAFDYFMVTKTRQHKLENCDLLPLITSSLKGSSREKVKKGGTQTKQQCMKMWWRTKHVTHLICLSIFHSIFTHMVQIYNRTFGFTHETTRRYFEC